MTTLRQWFDEFTDTTGEPIDYIVFGRFPRWDHDDERNTWPTTPNTLTRFSNLSDDILDRRFDDGFGGNETPDLCAWSDSFVIFSDNYDGAEGLLWVPRNPKAHQPIRPGGG